MWFGGDGLMMAVASLIAAQRVGNLHWRFGYPIMIVAILVICLVLYRTFRRNHWL